MIPKLIAKFETALASGISSTATTATLVSATTKDGVVIPTGTYGFVIDEGTATEEYIIATVTATALSSITRGLSYVDGTTSIPALKQQHRKGSAIKITDHPALMQYNAVVDLYAGHWEGAVANFAALPAGVNDGEVRVTLDDSKLYVWDAGTTAWILAGAGGGAGTMYTTVKLGSEADAGDNRTFSMSSGSFPDAKYLQVYKNGVLMENGASADYEPTGGNKAVFKYDVLDTDKITMVVVSVDIYNPEWNNIDGSLLPDIDNTHDIGSAAKSFKDAHIQGTATVGILAATTVTGDGSALSNMVPTMGTLAASDNLKYSADTERNHTGDAGIYQKVKEIKIRFEGTIRVKFDMKAGFNGNGSGTATGRIHKNGSVVGTERNNTTESYITYSEDIAVSAGDLIQLYYYPSYIDRTSFARNFRIYYDKSILADGVVNTD